MGGINGYNITLQKHFESKSVLTCVLQISSAGDRLKNIKFDIFSTLSCHLHFTLNLLVIIARKIFTNVRLMLRQLAWDTSDVSA